MKFHDRHTAYFSLILVAIIWGVASVIIKATLHYIEPMTFLYYRFALLLPIIIPWYIWYMKKHPVKKSELLPLTIFSLLSTPIYLSLIFWGFTMTTATEGNLLGTLNPLFIIILGVIILKEKLSKREKIGIGFAVTGTIVMVVQPIFDGSPFAITNFWGNLIILIASIIWAVFVLYSKKNFSHFSPVHITLHGALLASIVFPVLAFLENGMVFPNILVLLDNSPALWGVIYMAYISYILAYILYEYGMSKIEISEASLFTYLQPLFATPIAIIFLGETASMLFILGALIIFIGVAVSSRK